MSHWILQVCAHRCICADRCRIRKKQGAGAFGPLGIVTMSVYIALLVHYLIYGGLLAIYRINPRQFYARAKETTITAFVTRSSGGTLPVSLDVTQIKMGVSPRCFFHSRCGLPKIEKGSNHETLHTTAVMVINGVGLAVCCSGLLWFCCKDSKSRLANREGTASQLAKFPYILFRRRVWNIATGKCNTLSAERRQDDPEK